ncbi:hypothetical protein P7K49_021762, partial [Saguinus oedipus]
MGNQRRQCFRVRSRRLLYIRAQPVRQEHLGCRTMEELVTTLETWGGPFFLLAEKRRLGQVAQVSKYFQSAVVPQRLAAYNSEDALLEELERSTLQDSDEYSNPASLPPDQHSRKESIVGETSEILSVQDNTSPLPAQLVYTTNIQELNVYSEPQEPKVSPPPSKTSAAAQLDELMAHLSEMQAKAVKVRQVDVLRQTVTDHIQETEEPSWPGTMETFYSIVLIKDEIRKDKSEGSGWEALNVAVRADAGKKHLPDKQDHKASLDSMLGGLEQELQDLGIATVPKGHCASCQKPIAGKIGSSPFFERSGLAYCPNDYHHLFSPRCAYCAAPILDKVLTAMNQTWHPEHFFCSHCGEVFGAE